jgi:cysteine synthase A
MVCAVKGYRCVLLSSDAFAEEKLRTMRAFGAELRIVPSEGGKVTPALFEKFQQEIAVLSAEPDTFWTDQFHNVDSLDGYAEIGRELLEQTGGSIDVYCGAVGAGGMLAGVARALTTRWFARPDRGAGAGELAGIDRGATEARITWKASGPVAFHLTWRIDRTTRHGRFREERRTSDGAEARDRRKGCSSERPVALNIVAAIDLARELGPGKVVTTVVVDTGLKYLSGDLFAG